jgi:hypothetical protein
MRSLHQVILKFILFSSAKKYKLAVTQTCIFLHASANKINSELLRLAQTHSTRYILLLASSKKKESYLKNGHHILFILNKTPPKSASIAVGSKRI